MYLYRGECLRIPVSLTVQYFNETLLFRIAYYVATKVYSVAYYSASSFINSMDSSFMQHSDGWGMVVSEKYTVAIMDALHNT